MKRTFGCMNRANQLLSAESHHREGGGFRNPWAGAQPHGARGILKWAISRRRQPESAGTREGLSALQSLNAHDDRQRPDFSSPQSDALTVTWVGHSTFLIQCGGVNILTDPIWSARASPISFGGPRRVAAAGVHFESLPEIHVTLVSHDHYDHLDDPTVRMLIARFARMQWLVPLGVASFLHKRNATDIVELDWWNERDLGSIVALCTPAQHFSGRFPWNRDSTLWCGWAIRIGDFRVFFAGDTGLHGEFRNIGERFGPFNAAILPIGAYEPRWFMRPVHMDPVESVSAFQQLVAGAPKRQCTMIPSHWGTFRLTDEPLDEPPIIVRQAWSASGLRDELLAILRPGESRVIVR